MNSKLSFALTLVAALAAAPSTTLAQQARSLPTLAAPQAADQTLGVAIMSALVNGAAGLYDGAGAVSSTFDVTAEGYFVKFNRTLAHCASDATPRLPGLTAGSQVYPEGGDTVFVAFQNSNGIRVDTPFQLIVFCWK